jgi:hypothetical protein
MLFLYVILLVGAGVLYYVARQRERVVVADTGWDTGPAAPTAPPHRPSAHAAKAEPDSYRVALALGRVEARLLLGSPLLILALAFSIPFVLLYLDGEFSSRGTSWAVRQFPLVLYPYCGMILLATNRAVLRGRRDGTEELFGSLPVGRSTRTGAHLVSLVTPVAVGVLNVAVLLYCVGRGAGKAANATLWSYGGDGLDLQVADLAYLLQTLLLIACAGALGIAVARLVPSTLAGVAAIVVVGLVTARLNQPGDGLELWAPFVAPSDLPMSFFSEPGWWHAAYLLGLGTVAVGATWVLDGNRGRGAAALVCAMVLLVVGGRGQVSTLSPTVAADLAARVSDPADHQVCEMHGTTEYCAWPEFREWLPEWATVVEPVLAAAPADIAATASPVRQRLSPTQTARLEPAVRDRLEPPSVRDSPHVWPDDGALHPGATWYRDDPQELAVATGTWAVGLPTTMRPDGFPCYVSGQARGIVAIWLAGQALDRDARLAMTSTIVPTGEEGERVEFPLRFTDLGRWGTDQQGVVVWDRAELALAGQLLAEPDDRVRAELHGDWARWTDPTTGSDELAEAFDLDLVPVEAAPRGLEPC